MACNYIKGIPKDKQLTLQGEASLDDLATQAAASQGVSIQEATQQAEQKKADEAMQREENKRKIEGELT